MRGLTVFAVLTVFASGCAFSPASDATTPESVGTSRQAIIGGVYDPGDPAVVAFAFESKSYPGRYYAFCTGTLIAPQTVLTAGHCAHPKQPADGGVDPYRYVVLFTPVAAGTDPSTGNVFDCVAPECTAVDVVDQVVHPQFTEIGDINHDLTLLRLAQPVLDPEWIALSDTALDSTFVGRPVRHVGFGETTSGDDNSAGVKEQATLTISDVKPDRIGELGRSPQTCNGDSGGPAFLISGTSKVERLAGVVSYGDVNCALYGYDTRVDAYADWITSTAAWEPSPTCASDGYCVPTGCGTPDPDCRAFLKPCGNDSLCASQHCWQDPQHHGNYCTRPCTAATDCPSDMECAPEGFCQFRQQPEVSQGQPCTSTDFCADFGVCDAQNGDPPVCQHPCDPGVDGGTTCPYPTDTCVQGVNGNAYCQAPPPITLPEAQAQLGKTACAQGGTAFSVAALISVGALVRRRRRARIAQSAR